MRVLGIDPGKEGALALLDSSVTVESGERWIIRDVPIIGTGKQYELNALALQDIVCSHRIDVAFLEEVTAMRGWGSGSVFRFGGIFHAIKAVLACCSVPIEQVRPVLWKRFYGLKGPDKEQSRQRALRLFPELSGELARKKDQNRAEAALIANYALKAGSL